MARPSLYDPKYIDVIDEYLATTGREATTLPTREGFAKYIGVHRDTLNEWEHNYPDFKKALLEVDSEQKQQLMNDGLYGGKEINPAVAIFLMKVNHNMVEKNALDLTSQGEKIESPVLFIPKEED
jgi:uncharacterized Zn finger protein